MPTHTRIRMFNTKDTYPNQSLDNDLCQAVRAGNTVYVRGQVGTDFDGNLVGLGDPRAQAEQAMKNVKQLLEEAGSDLSHIVKTTTYLIDPRYREPVYREVGKWWRAPPSSRARAASPSSSATATTACWRCSGRSGKPRPGTASPSPSDMTRLPPRRA